MASRFYYALVNAGHHSAIYIMIYIPMIAAGITDPDMLRNEEMPPMVVVAMVLLMPVFLLGVMTFGIALNAAFLRICRQQG